MAAWFVSVLLYCWLSNGDEQQCTKTAEHLTVCRPSCTRSCATFSNMSVAPTAPPPLACPIRTNLIISCAKRRKKSTVARSCLGSWSHEQRGNHTLLLSKIACIDLKDQDDVLDVYRAQGSCASCPSGALNPDDFVDTVGDKVIREDVPLAGCDAHTLEPHITLVAHLPILEPRTDHVQAVIQTASFGFDNY